MNLAHSIDELRAALAGSSAVTFVPTMGNLHRGHLSLVRTARLRPGLVVASIFVNPLQFAPHEDFATYPRTFERDCELLAGGGCDLVFAPSAVQMYPEPQEFKVHPEPALADVLEGCSRPGFFVGVATVVLKLFNIVRPSAAVFGRKDYQQLRVIERLVRQFALPIDIIAAETERESSGLALSSRNGYLSGAERIEAAHLAHVLRTVADAVQAGGTDWRALEQRAADSLNARGWHTDYIAVRRRADLGPVQHGAPLVVLGAARLGSTRLIDNIEI